MNHVYSTTAFVLKSFAISESNKKLILLSKDFGVMRVNAQAVRKMESKLRPMIQDFCRAEFSVVRGNQGWRLVNAANSENFMNNLAKERFLILAKVFSLLDRLNPEEDGDGALYPIMHEFVEFLSVGDLDATELEGFEVLTVLKILNHLGYLERKSDFFNVVEEPNSRDAIKQILKHKKESVRVVNQAIKESHL